MEELTLHFYKLITEVKTCPDWKSFDILYIFNI